MRQSRMRVALASGGAAAALTLAGASGAQAYNYVQTANGESWGVQDAAAPRVDTGSIRDTTSNSLRGFGGIRVQVSTNPLRNGELMRGFLLQFDPPERFESTQSVDLGGVAISRSIRFNRQDNWGRWIDSFKNVTDQPVTVKVSFGGQTGIGNVPAPPRTPSTTTSPVATSSGDATASPLDAWVVMSTPDTTRVAPSAVVIGTPSPFGGAMTKTDDFLRDTFDLSPVATGHESNFVGYENTLTLMPGETKSLAHFVVIGARDSASTPGAQVAAVTNEATALAASPVFSDVPRAQLCSIVNWDVPALAIPAFDPATDCARAGPAPMPPLAPAQPTTTGSPYDVVGKTIDQLETDMENGVTTSQQITRAYLDRIAAYDVGPFGFNSMEIVARDAVAQARAADDARAAGASGHLLGVPLVVKNLYDTKDMPTTNGSLVFEGYQPPEDATQVADLRRAGAVILGKASLEEYALSGQYSDDAYGQVWNAFEPSASSIASSGGTAVATAASFAAGGLGTQTGDSLYGPSSAASLWSLRGTDGLTSSYGVMPLSWLQDYAGSIASSAGGLADLLDATTGTDPNDPTTVAADASAHRPTEWRDELDPNALRGRRIGYYDPAFSDPFGTTGTTSEELGELQYFRDAGATLVRIASGPTLPSSAPGDKAYIGWEYWIEHHPNSPYSSPAEILGSPRRLPYHRNNGNPTGNGYTGAGMMTDAQIQAYHDYRAAAKQTVANWLDSPPTPTDPDTGSPSPGPLDAVVYPGLKSDISLNDGGSSSFGRTDPPSNSAGTPTIVFPAGVNDHGEPEDLQMVGRAWSDPQLLSYAYAFDHVAHGQVEPTTVPPLPYVPDTPVPTISEPAPIAPVANPAPAPKAKPKPKVARRLTLTAPAHAGARGGKVVTLKARCAMTATTTCKATFALVRSKKTLAKTTVRVAAEKTTTVRLKLTKAAQRLLRERRLLPVTLEASVSDAKGRHVTKRWMLLRRVR